MTKYGDWIYRFILLVAVCIGLYLNSRYATRAELEELKSKVSDMQTTIKVMVEQNHANERQDARLDDHEKRLRDIEKIIPRGIP